MKKLRWTMDGQGFWEADVSTPKTIDGCAVPVPVSEHLLPLGLSRGIRLSRPKQIDFMQRFMSAPFIPFYSPSQGFALQRVFSIPFWDFGFPTFVCQFNLHKFINSFIIMMKEKKKNISSYGDHSSFLHHLSNKSLYALGFSSDFLLTPDDTLLISLDAYGDNNTIRTKALLHHKFLHHDLTMEALSPALFVDKSGNYWDVPVSLAIDLASSSSSSSFDSVSGLSYHLSMHHNAGSPTEQQTSPLPLPTSLLPGLSIKGALSLKKTFDIWRSKAHKLKMVQPYDIFLSNPHVSLLLITGAVATTYFGDNSVRSAAQDQFKGFHMQASRMKSAVLADVFASISLSAQYGMFQKEFLDLTRFCACLDFPSGSKFISGAMLLIEDHSNSQQPRTESIQAISPNARLSIQQQIAGPISLRVDSGVAIDLKKPGWVIQVEEPTIAVEYALQVLGSAKAIAWYSPKHREFMQCQINSHNCWKKMMDVSDQAIQHSKMVVEQSIEVGVQSALTLEARAMATKKIIAICQSGGEFVTNKDGSLSYNGGEAYAIDIDQQTQLDDLKTEVAEMFNCSVDTMSIKYFLPGNKKTLISVSKDKDLKRMINFLRDSVTVDVFILSDEAAGRNLSNMPASRSSRTTVSEAVVPVVELVDVAVETVMAINQIGIDISNEGPLVCVPASSCDEMHRKAAQQWENAIIGVDQRFNSFSEFREALHKYSIAHGFAYRYKKNDSHRVTVKCKSQGCPWRIYASRLSTTQLICIKKMNSNHTCEGAAAKAGYRATRGWVGNIIKEKLKVSPNYRPKDIADDIKREYGIQLNYSQAWRAKEIAREQLQGSYKEAYNQLPYLCDKIKESNPGSVASFTTKEDSSFHRLFISFHASIVGFQRGCRPLLFLDSTQLNSKYQGVLLTATAADGEDGIFPAAFAVVDTEADENWHWFLLELKSAVQTSQEITFVADFRNGLNVSLAEIFDKSYHSYCLRHLAEKLNNDLKGQFSHEARRFMINDFYAAALATKLDDFQRCAESIKGISPDAYNWILQSEPEHWANAFLGGARYNHITSNFGQQFYSCISEAHELPITQMIDVLRGKMMETIYTRRVESNRWTTKLTPSNEEKLQKEIAIARSLQVLRSHGSTFEVRGESVDIVDIDNWNCSCKGWQITGLPCCHAIAVFEWIGRSPYDFCSRYFTAESYRLTYDESINPIPNPNEVEGESSQSQNQVLAMVTVTPPPTRRPPGRPKMKQTESVEIIKRQLQCSKCKGLGHNKKTCKDS